MIKLSTLLFLAGTDVTSLFIVLIVLSIAGFFLWRILLKFFLEKGQTGINIAAFIVGSIQAPLGLAIIGYVIYLSIGTPERLQVGESRAESYYDSTMRAYALRRAADIDVVTASPDNCKVLLENAYVRVIQYSLKPGESDNPHTHPPKSYYVVAGGKLRVYPEAGEPFDADEVQGAVEWSNYVGKHYVQNIGTSTVTLLLTEVKGAEGYFVENEDE